MKKITLDFNFQLKDVTNKDMENETSNCGKFLARFLASATSGDAIKMWGWAQEFYQGKEIQLDMSDYDFLLKFVKGHKEMPVVGKAQIELAMIAAEKKSNA